ncbi:VapE domain-containing protein [uncultured Rothia sp.]|uniref:VapE domain-containing protein n=1 Tax=uncultured Rothia sp. TaxID=316088 RepID=UPI0026166A2C|nr:VapE domain-containing protein [uncultured Rothia sp.]
MMHEATTTPLWVRELETDTRGVPKNTLSNLDIISRNDPFLKTLGFCTRGRHFVEKPGKYHITDGPIPEVDEQKISTTALRQYLKGTYKFSTFSGDRRQAILSEIAVERAFDPVSDYLTSLRWDGISRLATALPGSEGTEYDYELARKIFVISVRRVFDPGWNLRRLPIFHSDNAETMRRWLSLLGRGYTQYFSSYGEGVAKDASRGWIAVFDISKCKSFDQVIDFWRFANRHVDFSRGRYRESLYRNWDVWAITSRPELLEEEYSPGRRFSIKIPSDIDFDKYTPGYIDQLWAEAVHELHNGYNDLLYIEDLKNTGGKLGYL